MRRSLPRLFVTAAACLLLLSSAASAEKKKGKSDETDKSLDGQMAWEKKVMGEDSGKKAEMKRIAAAQKMAEEARKNPPPEPAPKVKDPNKEGVRAKQEASIGLPTDSDQSAKPAAKKAAVAKKADKPSSANDELGALVATSLAEDRNAEAASKGASADKGKKGARAAKGGKKGHATQASSEPSSLDKMFANANK